MEYEDENSRYLPGKEIANSCGCCLSLLNVFPEAFLILLYRYKVNRNLLNLRLQFQIEENLKWKIQNQSQMKTKVNLPVVLMLKNQEN